jgi:hypothetical protein
MATTNPLQSITLTQNTAIVNFSNIDQTYTDLTIVISGGSISTAYPRIQFNGDTGNNYSRSELYVQGTQSGITMQCLANEPGGYFHTGAFSEYPETITIQINNYSSTSFNKTLFSKYGNLRTSGGGYSTGYAFCTWRNTSAINSITVEAASNAEPFATGMVISLYGIKAGTPKAIGGDNIKTDGTYWYHTFTSSGTFTVQQQSSLTVDYLVVAGGGGGGGYAYTAGGGAGGLLCSVGATGGGGSLPSAISLNPQSVYTVTVGAGGARGSSTLPAFYTGTVGSNSIFSNLTAFGGGGGAGYNSAGTSGGSGGGATSIGAVITTGYAGTTNQGYKGGDSNIVSGGGSSGGGGGGAGAVGVNGTTTNSGNGGAGVTTSISGSSTTYAGGGGGGGSSSPSCGAGSGGSGGGGAGSGTASVVGTSGTANTGSGGGGGFWASSNPSSGGTGGSGIVIVRYAV